MKKSVIAATLAAVAVREGKPDPALVAALSDKSPLVRGAASEALCRAAVVDQKPAVVALMDQLLLDRFARPEAPAYDDLRTRFLTMQAFWRRHPLAETAHPLFASEFGGI